MFIHHETNRFLINAILWIQLIWFHAQNKPSKVRFLVKLKNVVVTELWTLWTSTRFFPIYCHLGVCRMNHDAKFTGGIFRRRPSTASTSSRLSIQSGHSGSGSLSCPTSPRHQKHLPVVPSMSTTHLNDVLSSSITNYRDGPRHLHRSPSANYNYRQQSSSNLYNYTGRW